MLSAAGRTAPAGWTKLINNLEIGPGVGCCGTAAFSGERVIARDIESDPRWAPLSKEAVGFDLRACWSSPIFASDGSVLGTFAVYHREQATPTEWEMQLGDVLTGTASVAIERKHAEEELRETHWALTESEKIFRAFVTASSYVVYRMNADWTELRRLEGKAFIPDTTDPSRSWLDIYIHPDDQPLVVATMNKAIREKSWMARRDGPFRGRFHCWISAGKSWSGSAALHGILRVGKLRKKNYARARSVFARWQITSRSLRGWPTRAGLFFGIIAGGLNIQGRRWRR